MQFLIDTGSNKNYVQSTRIKNPIPNKRPFTINTVAGTVGITQHTFINIFGPNLPRLKFYILPTLEAFHGIIGNDTLREIKAIIHTDKNYMSIYNGMKIPLKQKPSNDVNNIDLRLHHLSKSQKDKLYEIIKECPNVFTDPNEKLTFTTNIKGEIRTVSESPIYSRPYPYPMALKAEVEKQIEELLANDIIRPSKSPYNSPVWIVDKKMDASGERKYRMVIDYRKLNSVTIPFKYPIPEINEVLTNLGKNKYFTTLDLKSGFHQIQLREEDIEKTAFSINNGKYEFLRLPFGLKNAPSIFQAALDNILRPHIGKICYVYIDDIIVFGKSEEEHFENLREVFRTLSCANMKIQLDKCEFLRSEVEFLGFVVSTKGISTNPKKVEGIVKMAIPKNLKDLRSFLGMAGYYRRFIRDYAKIAKPLTALLRGDAGNIGKNASRNKTITLDKEAIESFEKIKNALISDDVILSHPNFESDFELTTDASDYAIGAVLSQNKKPITFISRTLSRTEEAYATNEKEMLAIIWALTSLRNYLYGSKKVKITTDHQPLTFALSNKNHNNKMKRWKAILEEYNYELNYQPGRTNVVADALSRIPIQINTLTGSVHSDESSGEDLITCVENPINVYKNQIFLEMGEVSTYQFKIVFPGIHRHIIVEPQFTRENLIQHFKRRLNPSVINGIFTEERIMGLIQTFYPEHFRNFKTRWTQKIVDDITNEEQQEEIILKIHCRAHRNAIENKIQILEKYYFPGMTSKIKRITQNCTICKENKYDRHPNKPKFTETPLPRRAGEIVHIDIYLTEGKIVLTALDKFSKYGQTKLLKSRSIEDVRRPLRDILFSFGVPEKLVMDNEPSLNSRSIKFMLEDELRIETYSTPPYTSRANGQVEKFHSTLTEIMRCLKNNGGHRNFEELLERATAEYNHSVHSVTGKKPVDVFFGRSVNFTANDVEQTRQSNLEKLIKKQQKDLEYHNRNRIEFKSYLPGQIIYVRNNKRLGTKLSKRYLKEKVKEDRNSTVVTEKNRIIHKSLIRN